MSSQQGPGGEDKNSYGLLWGIAAIAIVGLIIWLKYGEQLKYGFMKVKHWELTAISYVVNDPILDAWNEQVEQAFKQGRIKYTTAYEASQVATLSGEYLRYPISIFLCFLAWYLYRGHASMRFNKIYDIDLLARQERKNWPQISPVVELDLIKEDINTGPWAVAMNPMQFSRHNKLLKIEMIADKKALWKSEGIPIATVIKDKATQVFMSQMGPLWAGSERLPPHAKALYAVFLLRGEHKIDEARALLAKLSISAAKGDIDYSEINDIIKKYGQSKVAQRCQEKHAYVLTVMASMLEIGRLDGVLASADFLWLKPVDRRLWYILNCVGRQVAVAEVAGPYAHWLAEKHMGRALSVPMIEGATNALEKAISNVVYVLDENEKASMQQAN